MTGISGPPPARTGAPRARPSGARAPRRRPGSAARTSASVASASRRSRTTTSPSTTTSRTCRAESPNAQWPARFSAVTGVGGSYASTTRSAGAPGCDRAEQRLLEDGAGEPGRGGHPLEDPRRARSRRRPRARARTPCGTRRTGRRRCRRCRARPARRARRPGARPTRLFMFERALCATHVPVSRISADLALVHVDAVREQRPRPERAGLGQPLDDPDVEPRERVALVGRVLGDVDVDADVRVARTSTHAGERLVGQRERRVRAHHPEREREAALAGTAGSPRCRPWRARGRRGR